MQSPRFIVLSLTLVGILVSATVSAADNDLAIVTAATHASDQPVATPAASTPPNARVSSRPAIYTNIDGQNIEGWLAWPAGKPMGDSPGLIVIHEWWGLNENIKQTSERLAAEGYVTLAVDLYRGESAETPKNAMKLMQALNAEEVAGVGNLAAAYDYLHNTMGLEKVGIVGWCLGGRWSLLAALKLPEDLDATVIYYGGVTDDQQQLATLEMPILGHFASKDPIVPPATVIAFRDALDELDKDADIYIYPDTKHAFANPSGLAYNASAAEEAWGRTTGFLAEHLQ
jgi:carboxymethylenebutenolidase